MPAAHPIRARAARGPKFPCAARPLLGSGHTLRAAFARIQRRIANLIDVLSSGEGSPANRDALRDMEARAKEARTSIAELENVGSNRVRLPSPDELFQKVWELEDNLRQDPIPGRELLRRFIDGDIRPTLGAEGVFTAETKILPLVLLGLETQKPVSSFSRPASNVVVAGAGFAQQISIFERVSLRPAT